MTIFVGERALFHSLLLTAEGENPVAGNGVSIELCRKRAMVSLCKVSIKLKISRQTSVPLCLRSGNDKEHFYVIRYGIYSLMNFK